MGWRSLNNSAFLYNSRGLGKKLKIDFGFTYTTDRSEGNKLIIRNLSNKAFIIAYWELFYRHKSKKSLEEYVAYPDIDSTDIVMQPFNTRSLNFSDSYYFVVSDKVMNGRNLFVRVHIAGIEKPIEEIIM